MKCPECGSNNLQSINSVEVFCKDCETVMTEEELIKDNQISRIEGMSYIG